MFKNTSANVMRRVSWLWTAPIEPPTLELGALRFWVEVSLMQDLVLEIGCWYAGVAGLV